VSLILEALKKLERERDTSGRGFLVVAPTPWRDASRGRWLRLAGVALIAGALAGAAAWVSWRALSTGTGGAPAAAPAAPAAAQAAGSTTPAPAIVASASTAGLPPPIWEAGRPASPPARAAATSRAAEPAPDRGTEDVAAPPPLAPGPPSDATGVLRLEAISVQEGEPVAVINGRLVRKGETVDGAIVTWIGADAVEVEVAGRRRTLGF
jgi:hypothetical protein